MSLGHTNHEGPIESSTLDRLVDGELDDAERRQLLMRLETEPGGWRRCALAFLEAQAWAETLAAASELTTLDPDGRIPPHDLQGPTGPSTASAERWRASAPGPIRRAGLRAAGIVLAFGIGWLSNGALRPHHPTPPRIPAIAHNEVSRPAESAGAKTQTEAKATERPAPGTSPELLTASELPTVEGDESPSWAANRSPVLTEPFRKELERQGYRVEQRTGLVSMELENGQSLAVPVDELEFHYVGHRTY